MRLRSSVRRFLPLLPATAVALALGLPAAAQQAPTTQELLDQIRILQKRIEQLEASEKQRQAARPAPQPRPATAASAASVPVTPAPAAPSIPPVAVSADPGVTPANVPDLPPGTFMWGDVKLTLGGYVDLTGYYRSGNENRGTGTAYNSIPFYGPTSQGDSGEFGLSAQQTRLTGKIEAPVGPDSRLTAYLEMDFNNGAGGANSTQSNSYTPRLRQAFGAYDDSGWQFVAGQAWTLATPFKRGLGVLDTWQPPTIDTNYMVGYTYLRTPLVRAVKRFDNVWIGVEANTPQTVFGGSSVPPAPGLRVVTTFPGGGSGLNPQANYSLNVAPDVVAKVAVDTRFGHIDVFGVARWFRDQVTWGTQVTNNDTFGGGVGASAFIPVGRWADVMGNVMYGKGIGRYGAGGLPDVTFAQDGSLTALPQGMGTVGLIGHVLPRVLDLYGYYGWNWVGASYFPGGGYGNGSFDNRGCFNANAGGVGCAGNNQMLSEWTLGLTWTMLRGRYGTVRSGLQYSNINRIAYGGYGGTPSVSENLFMFNFRYTPF